MPLGENLAAGDGTVKESIALGHALERLARTNTRQNRVVRFRLFGSLDVAQPAGALEISAMTAGRWPASTCPHRQLAGELPG